MALHSCADGLQEIHGTWRPPASVCCSAQQLASMDAYRGAVRRTAIRLGAIRAGAVRGRRRRRWVPGGRAGARSGRRGTHVAIVVRSSASSRPTSAC